MLSEIARHDLESLRAAGFAPTDAEVVALNDLGVRLERGKNTTVVNHPRMAVAGSVVLHEPTVGGVEWWLMYGKDAFVLNSSRLYGYYFMLAHCRDMERLNSLTRPKDITRAVRAWKRTIDATEDELFRAMLYARGADIETDVDKTATVDDEEALASVWRKVIMVSGSTGIKPEDLRTCVDSELNALLVNAVMGSGRIEVKSCVADLYIAYKKCLRAIEDRCNGKR